jgi:cytochrome b
MRAVLVWDLPTRVFHWALVILLPFLWWSATNDEMNWHKLAGFVLAALLVFRIYWGIFGSQTARFSDFLRGPRAVWRYLRTGEARTPGHNPLGGWSVLLLLIFLATETGLGLFAIDEDGLEAGPLAYLLTLDRAQYSAHLHSVLFDGLLAIVGLHIVAVLFYLLRRHNLIGPMLTGKKQLPVASEVPRMASFWSFAVGAALAGATFVWLWRLDNF